MGFLCENCSVWIFIPTTKQKHIITIWTINCIFYDSKQIIIAVCFNILLNTIFYYYLIVLIIEFFSCFISFVSNYYPLSKRSDQLMAWATDGPHVTFDVLEEILIRIPIDHTRILCEYRCALWNPESNFGHSRFSESRNFRDLEYPYTVWYFWALEPILLDFFWPDPIFRYILHLSAYPHVLNINIFAKPTVPSVRRKNSLK